MDAFEYASPTTVREAVELLSGSWNEAEVLAGGTDLLNLMKNYVLSPKRLVNIKSIRELGGIRTEGADVRIGAAVTFRELLESPVIREDLPALATAVRGVTSPQIRSMRTVGGDLCQRPYCWYFRNGYGLLARDGDGRALVPEGQNQYHAILGNEGPAYFVSGSSLAPALAAMEARIQLVGPGGEREVAVADFYRPPSMDGEREYVREANEIVTAVLIPGDARERRNATYEVRQRQGLDWPLASAAAVLDTSGGTVRQARIFMGHVAPVPWRAEAAEAQVRGRSVTEETAARAGDAAVEGARPLSKNGYKVQLARVAVKRALLAAAREA